MAPRLSLVSPKVFFSVLSPMEFWFLVAVASGLLSWGHFISSSIVDLSSKNRLSAQRKKMLSARHTPGVLKYAMLPFKTIEKNMLASGREKNMQPNTSDLWLYVPMCAWATMPTGLTQMAYGYVSLGYHADQLNSNQTRTV